MTLDPEEISNDNIQIPHCLNLTAQPNRLNQTSVTPSGPHPPSYHSYSLRLSLAGRTPLPSRGPLSSSPTSGSRTPGRTFCRMLTVSGSRFSSGRSYPAGSWTSPASGTAASGGTVLAGTAAAIGGVLGDFGAARLGGGPIGR